MNRLAGLLFSHTRSIQVLQYKDRVIYEIPLMYGETIRPLKPEVILSDHSIKITFPSVEWKDLQSSQSASTILPKLKTKNTEKSLNDSIDSFHFC